MPDVTFPVRRDGGVPVVGTPAAIDITNAVQFRQALLDAFARSRNEQKSGLIVVDMSRTQFCDSAGMHVLVAVHRRVRAEGGEVRLVMPGPNVLRVFAISGLDQVIPCHRSLSQALGQLSPEPGS